MKDGYGRKLSEEEVAKITGKPAQTDAQQHARPHVQSGRDGLASGNPILPSGDGDATLENGPGREREIIDEP